MSAEPMKVIDRRAVTVLADQTQQSTTLVVSPVDALLNAIQRHPDMDLDKLRTLIDLKRELQADDARRQFNEAFAAFKAEAIVIVKGTTIKDGPLKGKKHANLFDVVNAVTPGLSAHGLAISWKLTKDEKDWLEVTCTLRHAAGHSESVSMGSGPDVGPGRNAIQARASAKSYLERYTATAILGLAAADADDDGNGGSKQPEEVKAPEGYDRWNADMTALAEEGTEKLQDAWAKSPGEFRRHVVQHDKSWWDETKRKAGKVKVQQ